MTYNIDDIIEVLSESTADNIFNEYELFAEGKKIDTAKKVIKKGAVGVYTLPNTAINVANTAVSTVPAMAVTATSAIKEKLRNGKISRTYIRDTFKSTMNKIKTSLKVGEVIAVDLALSGPLGPIGLLTTGYAVSSMTLSNDPSDKEAVKKVKDIIKKFSDGFKKFINKAKSEPVTKEMQQEFDKINVQGLDIAKRLDTMRNSNINGNITVESVDINKYDEFIINETGTLVENAFDILNIIIESTDYDRYDIYPIIDRYCNMI